MRRLNLVIFAALVLAACAPATPAPTPTPQPPTATPTPAVTATATPLPLSSTAFIALCEPYIYLYSENLKSVSAIYVVAREDPSLKFNDNVRAVMTKSLNEIVNATAALAAIESRNPDLLALEFYFDALEQEALSLRQEFGAYMEKQDRTLLPPLLMRFKVIEDLNKQIGTYIVAAATIKTP